VKVFLSQKYPGLLRDFDDSAQSHIFCGNHKQAGCGFPDFPAGEPGCRGCFFRRDIRRATSGCSVWFIQALSVSIYEKKGEGDMLRMLNEVAGYRLEAEDGALGAVKDFLFDEEFWTVRHMVADTRKWLPGRKVLVSPMSINAVDWTSRKVDVVMTKEDVQKAPELDEDAPVSREYERRWYDAYGMPYYWGTPAGAWGGVMFPADLVGAGQPPEAAKEKEDPEEDRRVLRSAAEVAGYHIQTGDGEIGHVDDYIFDDETWTIRYLVVDTRNWLPGRNVLLAPGWLDSIYWADRDVTTSLSREAVQRAPEFDPSVPVNREYEQRLYDYYGRPVYWNP